MKLSGVDLSEKRNQLRSRVPLVSSESSRLCQQRVI
jgi:hypothetical protein